MKAKSATQAKQPKHEKKVEHEDPLYIGITNSTSVQRSLLEGTKGVLELIRDYKAIHEIRQQKKETFEKFDKTIEELKASINKLKHELPLELAHAQKKTVSKTTPVAKRPVTQARNAQLDDLDQELADIEAKLSKL